MKRFIMFSFLLLLTISVVGNAGPGNASDTKTNEFAKVVDNGVNSIEVSNDFAYAQAFDFALVWIDAEFLSYDLGIPESPEKGHSLEIYPPPKSNSLKLSDYKINATNEPISLKFFEYSKRYSCSDLS